MYVCRYVVTWLSMSDICTCVYTEEYSLGMENEIGVVLQKGNKVDRHDAYHAAAKYVCNHTISRVGATLEVKPTSCARAFKLSCGLIFTRIYWTEMSHIQYCGFCKVCSYLVYY